MLAHESLTGNTQNITAFIDATRDNILKDFRCNCCGSIVFQYYGGIELILPGEVSVDWIDIVGRPKPIQCKNKNRKVLDPQTGNEENRKCKTIYYVIG